MESGHVRRVLSAHVLQGSRQICNTLILIEVGKDGSHRYALGRPISQADAQIAAVAQTRGAKLARRNIGDLTNCGIEVAGPWNGL
jgi:predicted nucleic acid-binding protein